ncbi:ABC transporter permease [Mycoplasma yeatsii]|uniref:ABC transporter permease n=1 Tax=Mycoplasma yeatsii TaxID=51365 RepID=UPI0005B24681|nr:ABC transporter permease [Mycoplasma yeatsii]AJM71793.1 permease family protein [Mycoplasma yeatsii GM274B]
MNKNITNFFLLLKQGVKGVFKFRIQFTIILLLSFLASFILSTSITLSSRIDNTYNNIVNNVKKFDHISSNQISINSQDATDTTDRSIFPLLDLVSDNSYYNKKTNDKNTSFLNFVLNEKALQNTDNKKTLITEMFADKVFASFFKDITTFDESNKTNASVWSWQLTFYATQFAFNKYNELIKNNQNVDYLKDTVIGRYILNTSDTKKFNDIINKINEIEVKGFDKNWSTSKEGQKKVIELFNTFSNEEKEFFSYIYASIHTLIEYISKKIYLEIFNPIVDKFEKSNKKLDHKGNDFYNFLVGRDIKDIDGNFKTDDHFNGTPEGFSWIINDKNKPYLNNFEIDKTVIKENEYKIITKDSNVDDQIKKIGMRGMTDIVIADTLKDQSNNKTVVTNIEPKVNDFSLFKLITNNGQSKSLTKKVNIYHQTRPIFSGALLDSIDNHVSKPNSIIHDNVDFIHDCWLAHLRYTALASGYDISFRREIFTYDYISNTRFRMVFLDDNRTESNTTNLTILNKNAGARMPRYGEVLISEQYALEHNYKIGDQIKVESANLTITGYATDTYSFFPSTDPDFPIPQSKLGAVIYAGSQTIKNILSGTSTTKSNETSKGYEMSFLRRNKNFNIETSKNLFNAFQLNDVTRIYDSVVSQQSKGKTQFNTWLSLTDFNSSNLRFNWTIEPKVIRTYQIITLVSAIVVSVIAVVALIICIRKTIHFNAKQIGILKALGTEPLMISVTYLSYSLIIISTVVPLGWVLGLVTQSGFIHLFINYFSLPLYQFTIEPISLIVSLIIFGLIGGAVSLLTSYLITKQSVIDILKVTQKWSSSKLINRLKNSWFKKAKFPTKFSLTLASSGKKNIILLSTVVGVSTFVISTGLAIPSIAFTTKKAYYNSIKYANEYKFLDDVTNSPLTKKSITYWHGQDHLDKDIKSIKIGPDVLDYYSDPSFYASSSYDVTPFSKYVYSGENKLNWTLLRLLRTDIDKFSKEAKTKITTNNLTTNNEIKTNEAKPATDSTGLDLIFTEFFGNNLYNVVGSQFSVGVIDQILGIILNSKYNLFADKKTSENWDDLNKSLTFKNTTNNITIMASQVITSLLGRQGGSSNGDWKDRLLDAIKLGLPPYVNSFLQKSLSRKEQFAIGYNIDKIIPKKETPSTVVDANATFNNKNIDISFTGIADNQTAFEFKKRANDKLFVDYPTLLEIQKAFLGTQTDNIVDQNTKFKYYDKQTNTLNIPIIPNKQAAAFYGLSKKKTIENISTSNQHFFIKTNKEQGYIPIPKYAWIYDDSNFINSDYYKNNLEKDYGSKIQNHRIGREGVTSADKARWLDPYNLDNNKITFKIQYENDLKDNTSTVIKDQKLKKDSYMFDDFIYNDEFNGIESSYIRPYYEYKNIQLYIPQSFINVDDIINANNSSKKDLNISDEEKWYRKDIPAKEVAKSVKNAWSIKENSDEKFLMIRPYDLRYTFTSDKVAKTGADNFLSKPLNWITKSTSSANRSGIDVAIMQKNTKVNYQNSDLKIKATPVDVLDSYNGKLTLVDQGLANLVMDYSLGKKIGIKDNLFNKTDGVIKAGEKDGNDIISAFDRYEFNQISKFSNPGDKFFETMKFVDGDIFKESQMMWHNSKYSNVASEPLELTSGISFVPPIWYNGSYLIGTGSAGPSQSFDIGSMVKNQTLLETSKQLIDQVTFIAISIGMLLIITVIVTSALLVMLIGDIYVSQYQQFMTLMKALGYSTFSINKYAFGTVSILSLLVWVGSTILTWSIISIVITIITRLGFAIPYGFALWTLFTSIAIVGISFVGSLLVSSNKIRKKKPASLLKETTD